jgi:hypothetical protein
MKRTIKKACWFLFSSELIGIELDQRAEDARPTWA